MSELDPREDYNRLKKDELNDLTSSINWDGIRDRWAESKPVGITRRSAPAFVYEPSYYYNYRTPRYSATYEPATLCLYVENTSGHESCVDIYDSLRAVLAKSGKSRISPKIRERVTNERPQMVDVIEFANGMEMIAPQVWSEWMERAGLPGEYVWNPIIKGPIFEKIELRKGEALIRIMEGEEWVQLPRKDETSDVDFFGVGARTEVDEPRYRWGYRSDPRVGEILRISEGSCSPVEGSRNQKRVIHFGGNSYTISPEFYNYSNRYNRVDQSTAQELIVGENSAGFLFVPKAYIDEYYGDSLGGESQVGLPGEILKAAAPSITIETFENEDTAEDIARQTGCDQSRIENMIELRRMWNDAYLAVCRIENQTRTRPYIACILPDTVDGTPAEHAVAENADYGNAAFVVLGGGKYNWQEVLVDRTKQEASGLGAIRVPHTEGWQDRILELITQPR